ncbi:MAG: cell division protein ZapA [Spirochaetales bacterium]|nr:cell division protein ZapA [Spirochaetales bacterium]MCF7937556.1 cell division protein ZapA [Spirochaetales bacterium]
MQANIEILGTRFTIQTDEDPEYIESLVAFVKEKLHELRKNVGVSDPMRLALLTSIVLSDEIFKMRNGESSYREADQVEDIAARLIQEIDNTLDT